MEVVDTFSLLSKPLVRKPVLSEPSAELYVALTLIAIGIPVAKKVPIIVPSPRIETVPENYPVPVLVSKPVPYEVKDRN